MQLVLASTSSYRKALLDRLRLNFVTANPSIDETPLAGEPPEQLAKRLALAKAKAVADSYPDALIIGSDQVAVVQGQILGKPGTRDGAQAQLEAASGKNVCFLTSLCLYNSRSKNYQLGLIPFQVVFRDLSQSQIRRYIELDNPLDCAGSFKWEQTGIVLFKSMQGSDVTSLQGLPLITLTDMLLREGVSPLEEPH